MKKFAVLRKIGVFNASVVREFNTSDDAEAFRALMCRSEDNDHTEYFVVENLSYRDPNEMCACSGSSPKR